MEARAFPKTLKQSDFLIIHLLFDISITISSLEGKSRYIKKEMKKKSTEEDDAPKPKKIKEVYNLHDVIKQNYKALVEAEIPYKSTDKEYLGSYQRAVTTVLANMEQEDLDEVQNILDAWNDQGAPPEVQLK